MSIGIWYNVKWHLININKVLRVFCIIDRVIIIKKFK